MVLDFMELCSPMFVLVLSRAMHMSLVSSMFMSQKFRPNPVKT